MSDGSEAGMRIMFAEAEAPLRMDGMRLCPGCEERFVLEGYCAACKPLEAMYAEKEAVALRERRCRSQPRLDMGVGEFSAVTPQQKRAADGLFVIVGFSLATFTSPLLFAWMKAAIAWLWAFSR